MALPLEFAAPILTPGSPSPPLVPSSLFHLCLSHPTLCPLRSLDWPAPLLASALHCLFLAGALRCLLLASALQCLLHVNPTSFQSLPSPCSRISPSSLQSPLRSRSSPSPLQSPLRSRNSPSSLQSPLRSRSSLSPLQSPLRSRSSPNPLQSPLRSRSSQSPLQSAPQRLWTSPRKF